MAASHAYASDCQGDSNVIAVESWRAAAAQARDHQGVPCQRPTPQAPQAQPTHSPHLLDGRHRISRGLAGHVERALDHLHLIHRQRRRLLPAVPVAAIAAIAAAAPRTTATAPLLLLLPGLLSMDGDQRLELPSLEQRAFLANDAVQELACGVHMQGVCRCGRV